MKRRITLSIALVLSVALLSLMSFDSTANTAAPQRQVAPQRQYVADTGVITLGPNQLLRITVAPAAGQRSRVDSLTVTFSRQVYTHGTCNDSGVCIHTGESQTTTDSIRLMASEGASMDITQTPNSSGVRSMVLMDRPDAEVNALIIDTNTGEVRSNKLFVGGLSW